MVDVADKAVTHRSAVAGAFVEMAPETLELIVEGDAPKGDVLATARIAGIMAAKRTRDLIPLCHPLPLTHAAVELVAERASADGRPRSPRRSRPTARPASRWRRSPRPRSPR